MTEASRAIHRPRPDIFREQGRDARARAWSFVFKCWHEKQEGGPPTAPDDRKKESKHVPAEIKSSP